MLKKALLFTAAMLPAAFVGSFFTVMSIYNSYTPALQQQLIASSGSYQALLILGGLQGITLIVICGFLGYICADKIGLVRPFRFQKESLLRTAVITVICGILFSLDYWVFGSVLPQLGELLQNQNLTAASSFLSGIFYGGIVEEVLLRLFLMSLFVLLLRKLFAGKYGNEKNPGFIFLLANILAATLFAAGHLPANFGIFGALTPVIVFRCFLMNGGFGLVFGWLYYKYGIQYAMFAHAGVHIVSKIIWLLLL